MEKTWGRYIQDVLSGKRLACKWERLAVERHLRDMTTAKDRGFVFDGLAAGLAIDIVGTLNHTKGKFAGQPVALEPWQQFKFAMIHGWRRADGLRRFTTAYIEEPRKNGKSTEAAADGVVEGVMAQASGDGSPEIYSAATTRDQAHIVWDQAVAFSKGGYLSKSGYTKAFRTSLTFLKSNGFFKPLASDSDTLDGLNPSMVILDEYHAHKTDELRNVLRSGMGARPAPLFYIITTAGLNKNCPCYKEHESLKRILLGQVENDSYFGIIYTLDDTDDWRDEKNWYKANPNLGVSISIDDMRSQYREALASPSKENEFKTKRLNVWTQASTRWLTTATWLKNQGPVKVDELIGRPSVVAVDLSTVRDLSAVVAIFPPLDTEPNGKYLGIARFYIPAEGIEEREKSEGVPYRAWIEQGYVIATPGNSISYDVIEADVKQWAEDFRVLELAYDPYNATEIVQHWEDHGIPCVKFLQNIMSQSPALKEYERLHLNGQVAWGGNPVMEYMASCAEVWSDANGNLKLVKPDRRASASRIDGIAAGAMALYRAVLLGTTGGGGSIYDTREVLVL